MHIWLCTWFVGGIQPPKALKRTLRQMLYLYSIIQYSTGWGMTPVQTNMEMNEIERHKHASVSNIGVYLEQVV